MEIDKYTAGDTKRWNRPLPNMNKDVLGKQGAQPHVTQAPLDGAKVMKKCLTLPALTRTQLGAKATDNNVSAQRTPPARNKSALLSDRCDAPCNRRASPSCELARNTRKSPQLANPEVPPLVRHLILISEAYHHELRLIPIISAAVERHLATTPRQGLLSGGQRIEFLLERDLGVAYSLIADDIRKEVASLLLRGKTLHRAASSHKIVASTTPTTWRVTSATTPTHLAYSSLQARVHTSVSWNSSVLVLKHPYIIQTVCGALGTPCRADSVTDGVLTGIIDIKGCASQFKSAVLNYEDTRRNFIYGRTPLLEGFSGGVLLPTSAASACLIHNYNAQLLMRKKSDIARNANAKLAKRTGEPRDSGANADFRVTFASSPWGNNTWKGHEESKKTTRSGCITRFG